MTARLSSPEVKKRLQQFSKRFRNAENEQREATMFWAGFYNCFGISAAEATVFEQQVRKLDGNRGRIDSFIPGLLIVEHKSRGRDLEAAYEQAEDYFIALKPEERPKYIITSDFARIVIYDLATKQRNETSIEDLPKHASWFKFLVEGKQDAIVEEREIDRSAAYTISKLHEALLRINFKGIDLEVFLTRLLFCLFADDTGIFYENGQFRRFVESAKEDGSDVGQKIGELFEVLNTADDDRFVTLEDNLKAFPYINGNLFAERTRIPVFDSDLRKLLISCATLDWSGISPAIFGAMFQGVLEEHNTTEKRQATRRELGAHYTSERNILRVINPLFLDELREEFEACKRTKNKTRLKFLYDKLSTLTFFDPACGCGNFLVIAYRELRKLENDVIAELFGYNGTIGGTLDVSTLCRVKLHQFYGIEIDEAAAHIARVALYITDHQMNDLAAERFGYSRPTIPLTDNPQVTVGNALRIDWQDVLPAVQCSYVFGNPPFIGHQWRSSEQVIDMDKVWGDKGRFGRLDYVSCWYKKSVDYMRLNVKIQTALVSTNSITQGEQVPELWSWMLNQSIFINFAHRTFVWSNEGKGVAAVHCVVVGFSLTEKSNKKIFLYEKGDEIEPTIVDVKRINPYLIEASNLLLPSRANAIDKRLLMTKGSQPTDGGFLVLNEEEKVSAINLYPELLDFIKPYVGSKELINSIPRYCLWLKDANPEILKNNLWIRERLEGVARSRLESSTKSVVEFAKLPYLFTQDRQPNSTYIAIPEVSSERRSYIPIAYLNSDTIASNKIYMLLEGRELDFSILNSSLHMAWMRCVSGRLKSDYSYSPSVYYNFPIPNLDGSIKLLEDSTSLILSIRKRFSNFSLAQLYDRLSMPLDLLKAHEANDKAVDKAYSYKGKNDDTSRVAFLFKLYEEQTSLLPTTDTKTKRIKKIGQNTKDFL